MIEINCIITCYNKENYLKPLLEIVNSYKNIKVNYVIAYNGLDPNFPAHIKQTYIPWNGRKGNDHPHGCPYGEADCDLIIAGYEYLKNNNVSIWMKLSVDSWVADEDKLIQIINCMNKYNTIYGGNFWYQHRCVSTDICFFNTKNINIFEEIKKYKTQFFDYLYNTFNPESLELLVGLVTMSYDRLILLDREPMSAGSTRWQVPKLGWTMSHVLETNLNFVKSYISDNNNISYQIVSGNNFQSNFENFKRFI